MKVLLANGETTAEAILSFNYDAGSGTEENDAGFFSRIATGKPYGGKGVVADLPDAQVKAAVRSAAGREGEFLEAKDFNRDLKFIAQVCGEYEDGTEVACEPTTQGFKLVPDESGRIQRAENLGKGDTVAVGPNISPKTLMNARGMVVSINGTRAAVELEDSDLDRVRRASGKDFKNPVSLPKSVLEKVA